jgi:hypothetical protein
MGDGQHQLGVAVSHCVAEKRLIERSNATSAIDTLTYKFKSSLPDQAENLRSQF